MIRRDKMKYINIMILAGFILSGCTSSGVDAIQSGAPYMYKGMNFGYDRDTNYKLGVVDGCRTATGAYTKNHELFNNNESYKFGWGEGRIKCHNKVPKI